MTFREREDVIDNIKTQIKNGYICLGVRDKNAISVIDEAISKQIPMKANEVDVQPYFRKHFSEQYTCPSCHKEVNRKWNGCPYCLQKIYFLD